MRTPRISWVFAESAPIEKIDSETLEKADIAGTGRPLKEREGRRVLDLEPCGLPGFVAKSYRVHGLAKRLVVTLVGGKGRREWELARRASSRGVAVPRPIAYGVARQGGLVAEEWLISKKIEGAVDLATFARSVAMGGALAPSAKRPWIEAFARLVARMHEAGLLHEDLHAGNVLGRVVDGAVHLHLIDLDGAHVLGPAAGALGDEARIAGLAVVNRFFFLGASRTDRWRFLCAYDSGGDRSTRSTRRKWASEIEALTLADSRPFWEERLRRYTRSNRYVARLVSGSLAGWVDREFEGWGFMERLGELDRWMELSGESFKDSRSSCVVRLVDPRSGKALFVKRFNPRFSKKIASLVRPTKAMRAWRGAWRMLMRNLATPRPVAVLERRRGPISAGEYLITLEVAPARTLDRELASADGFPAMDLARAVGRALRTLGERGLVHGDLKPSNILVRTAGGRPEVHLVDLESLRRSRSGLALDKLARLARGLRQAGATRTTCLAGLLAFLGPGRAAREAWKPAWRRIEGAAVP